MEITALLNDLENGKAVLPAELFSLQNILESQCVVRVLDQL